MVQAIRTSPGYFMLLATVIQGSVGEERRQKARPLYYVPTTEGLSSRWGQTVGLWNAVKLYNRSIIEVPPTNSDHVHLRWSMCDVFPIDGLECRTDLNSSDLITHLNCTRLTQELRWGFDTHMADSLPYVKEIEADYNQLDCVVGPLLGFLFLTYGDITAAQQVGPSTFQVGQRYQVLATKLWSVLMARTAMQTRRLDGTDFLTANHSIAFHWRRGDQSFQRCGEKAQIKAQRDDSVNCRESVAFLREARAVQHQFVPAASAPYVATNEVSKETLAALKTGGMQLYSDIAEDVQGILMSQVTPLDVYVTELLILCTAEYYAAWGRSGSHSFVLWCRQRLHGNAAFNTTVIDNVLVATNAANATVVTPGGME
eukprot:CAMPEP_0198666176 /NCGR_PEP_ID=MMETSP1467-20131203/63564_1 /TAXON_ID=1462469 /ORGANISM="unid. sp., Strain CCMP2135" /LENGTH=370 /DNA_ID=CAMNT_0044402813 /DNA_START=1 /DNA_END=1113 /DNA_ORIENTATION=-